MDKITHTDFEEILGFNISEKIKQKIENYNLIFRDLDEKELNDYYNKNLEVLTSDIAYSGSHRKNDWESGWGENLNNFITTKNNEDLIPKYHGKNKIVKWRQKPILPLIENFDLKIHICFIDSIIEHYSNGIKSIYEFGCGPGYHLLRFSEYYPNIKLYGGDWAESSQKTILEINKNFKSSITPFNFNFFSPDMDMDIDDNSLFYTVAALEQVGSNFRRYIDYIMEKKPKICINIEPISELLDENNFFDNLSIKYFKKRNYLNGYLDFLIDYEKRGFIEILDKRRIYSGSYFIEGHSLIVWRPL